MPGSEDVRKSVKEIFDRNTKLKANMIPGMEAPFNQVYYWRQLHQDIADLAIVVAALIPKDPEPKE